MDGDFATFGDIGGGRELVYGVEVGMDDLLCLIDCMFDYVLFSCEGFGGGEGGVAYVWV